MVKSVGKDERQGDCAEGELMGDDEHAGTPRGVGRNEACPCGSGRKYKKCHLRADEESAREARARAREDAAREGEEGEGDPEEKNEGQPALSEGKRHKYAPAILR